MAWTDYLKQYNPVSIGANIGRYLGDLYSAPTYNEAAASQRRIGYAQSDLQRILAQGRAKAAPAPSTPSLYGGGGGVAESRPWIPAFDPNAIWNQAKQTATGQANAWYQSALGEFQQKMAAKRRIANENYNMQIQDYEKGLKDFLEQSGITRGRTEEDVATNLGQLREDEAVRQQLEGRQFDVGRRSLQDFLGSAGLTRSGLGRQQLEGAKEERQITEGAAKTDVGRKKAAQELYRTRTLGDLARGEKLKGEATETGKKRSKIDLDREFEDLLFQETEKKRGLELEKESKQFQLEDAAAQGLWKNYLGGLKGYEQQEEAGKRFGYWF